MGKIGKYHEIRVFRAGKKGSQTWKTAKKQAQTPFSAAKNLMKRVIAPSF